MCYVLLAFKPHLNSEITNVLLHPILYTITTGNMHISDRIATFLPCFKPKQLDLHPRYFHVAVIGSINQEARYIQPNGLQISESQVSTTRTYTLLVIYCFSRKGHQTHGSNWFSKFFHLLTHQLIICSQMIIKDPTIPWTRCYPTLWNACSRKRHTQELREQTATKNANCRARFISWKL